MELAVKTDRGGNRTASHVTSRMNIKQEAMSNGEERAATEPSVKTETNSERGEVFDDGDEADNLLFDGEDGIYFEDKGFRILQVDEPDIVRRPVADLYRITMNNRLVLDTAYQRGVVWDPTRSSLLIASLFQRYYVPPIIFNCRLLPDSDDPSQEVWWRFCVDGKQRLTSIKRFMNGEIPVVDNSIPPKKWFYCHPMVNGVEQRSSHLILPESTKKFFRERELLVYEYTELPQRFEETMFQLVQRGMPLTPAERMRAMSTNWAEYAKKFEQDYFKILHLCATKRASDFRCVIIIFATVLDIKKRMGTKPFWHAEYQPMKEPVLQSSVAASFRFLHDIGSFTTEAKATVQKVFDRYLKLVDKCTVRSKTTKLGFRTKEDTAFDPAPQYLVDKGLNHVRTFSPLELVSTAVLILLHGNQSDKALLDHIKGLRAYLREKHQDLRMNAACWKNAWEYMISIDGSGDQREDSPEAANGGAMNGVILDPSELPGGAQNAEAESDGDYEVRAIPRKRRKVER